MYLREARALLFIQVSESGLKSQHQLKMSVSCVGGVRKARSRSHIPVTRQVLVHPDQQHLYTQITSLSLFFIQLLRNDVLQRTLTSCEYVLLCLLAGIFKLSTILRDSETQNNIFWMRLYRRVVLWINEGMKNI